MTSVLVTIDTELSPAAHQRGRSAQENFDQAILGQVSDGAWGIDYQIRHFDLHGIKAVFFVEALSASVAGLDTLKRTIEPILSWGHEVQLHAHTEWLEWFANDPLDGRRGQNIGEFSYDDQCRLLEIGVDNLTKAGAPRPVAFRAGNFGANNDTLRALANVGIRYDSSYSFPYLGKPCHILTNAPLLNPVLLDGSIEVPVAFFEDYPDHTRHTQLCAASIAEMRTVLAQSVAQARKSAVIVSHSFELLNRTRDRSNRIVVRRFERFCELLGEVRTQAPTCGFADLDPNRLIERSGTVAPLRSVAWRTASRMVEQAMGTILYG
jgi:hypothetical protein